MCCNAIVIRTSLASDCDGVSHDVSPNRRTTNIICSQKEIGYNVCVVLPVPSAVINISSSSWNRVLLHYYFGQSINIKQKKKFLSAALLYCFYQKNIILLLFEQNSSSISSRAILYDVIALHCPPCDCFLCFSLSLSFYKT